MKSYLLKFKWWIGTFLLLLVVAAIYLNSILFASNSTITKDHVIVIIPNAIEWQSWINSSTFEIPVKNKNSFALIARFKDFKTIKAGRYKFLRGMSNNEMINMLRIGKQEPLRIRIDDTVNLFELAARLGKSLKADSTAFMTEFESTSEYSEEGFSGEKIACLIHPDTYDFFWTMTPKEFLEKMFHYHKKYFSEEKTKIAVSMGLTVQEVYILASIVKAETAKKEEAPKIAGLYLNRLKIGMPLQSDPTVVFAAGIKHMKRVTGILATDSPYNTYLYQGLPPGPINFVENIYLDAILNPEKSEYLYMCAQPGNTGYHNFSESFKQHTEYARIYREWLNQNGIN